ncbi:MAG: 50S ribosomal protein L25/general stress protein Ctc [Betaproteobacteria bacterium]|nr:50S ribosomal protein L25/general stress protein Ctc [Betaproteobacteria bacterium]
MEFTAFPRNGNGTGPSRRMRRTGKVPGVVYGAGKDSQMIEVDHNALARHLKMESFHASILDMNLDGGRERVLLRNVQMHPWKTEVLHVDFQRIAADRKIHMKVPLHFVHAETCPGAKEGGVVSHVMNDLDIQCLPDDLPEFVEVDLSALQLGDAVHVSELSLPKGVELVPRLKTDNPVVVTVQMPREMVSEETAAEATVAAAGTEAAAAAPDAAAEKKEAGK